MIPNGLKEEYDEFNIESAMRLNLSPYENEIYKPESEEVLQRFNENMEKKKQQVFI